MADEPALTIGDTGDWVAYLQQLLEYHGYGGSSSGSFDEATQNAVIQMQQQSGLNTTGVCDSETWAVLTASASASSTSGSGDGTEVPDDIAVSMQIEVAAPDGEIMLSELEPLPQNAVS